MRLATWNVNSVVARLPRLLEWLELAKPDVLCLQETKVPQGGFPESECAELGYEVAANGEGRWNGVAVLSKVGLEEVTMGFAGQPGWVQPDEPEPGAKLELAPGFPVGEAFGAGGAVEARALGATCGGLRVWSVYVPNGRALGSAHYHYKLAWLSSFAEALRSEVDANHALAVCGDFNIAPRDEDVWDPAAFAGSTHVSKAERDALGEIMNLGFTDVVARPLKYDRPYTYWDYRAGMFHKNMGMRIDLVLLSPQAAASVTDAYVDRDARKGKGPSDHAPVVVDLDL